MTYRVTAYCKRREQWFGWQTGKRGLDKLLDLIKKEGLVKLKVTEI